MNGLTFSWVMVGVLLWGLPTAFGLCFMLANISSDGGLHFVPFQGEVFVKATAWLLPLFIFGGIGLGMMMGRMCERACRK